MKKQHQDTLSDLIKLGHTAANTLLGAAQQMGDTHSGGHNILSQKIGYVTRDEFDAAFAMIKKARQTQIDLEKRITQIEEKMNLSTPEFTSDEKQTLTDS